VVPQAIFTLLGAARAIVEQLSADVHTSPIVLMPLRPIAALQTVRGTGYGKMSFLLKSCLSNSGSAILRVLTATGILRLLFPVMLCRAAPLLAFLITQLE
jgi:hypothetical protein